jgi:hypothetical protein
MGREMLLNCCIEVGVATLRRCGIAELGVTTSDKAKVKDVSDAGSINLVESESDLCH